MIEIVERYLPPPLERLMECLLSAMGSGYVNLIFEHKIQTNQNEVHGIFVVPLAVMFLVFLLVSFVSNVT